MIELLLDREMIGTLDDSADMIRSKTNVLAYGNKIKKVALEKNILCIRYLKLESLQRKQELLYYINIKSILLMIGIIYHIQIFI